MVPLTKKLEVLAILSRGYLQSLCGIETTSQTSPSVTHPGALIIFCTFWGLTWHPLIVTERPRT